MQLSGRVVAHSPSRKWTSVSSQKPVLNLRRALDEYENCLSSHERNQFRSVGRPDTAAVIGLTALIDRTGSDNRHKCTSMRFMTFLDSAQQFSDIVGTFINSHPEIASLVWGGIKLALLTTNNVTSYFDKISELFMSLGESCPRFKDYSLLYPSSARVQTALCNYYAAVIRLCRHSVEASRQSSFSRLLNAIHTPFEVEYRPFTRELKKSSDEFNTAVDFATKEAEVSSFQRQKDMQQEQCQQSIDIASVIDTLSRNNRRDLEQRLQLEKHRALEHRTRVLDMLSNDRYRSTYIQIRNDCTPGTSTWVLEVDAFRSWEAKLLRMIWCCGKLGSGKSVTSTSIISHIMETKSADDQASFFFCRPDDKESLKTRTIIGAIAKQFAGEISLSDFADLQGNEVEAPVIVSFLIRKLSRSRHYFIIVDGIDECDDVERKETMELFSKLQASPLHISICCSSRPAILSHGLPSFFQPDKIINMEDPRYYQKLAYDMNLFVEKNLRVKNKEIESIIMQKLQEGAEGMFLWVKLQLETLHKANSDNNLLEALRSLPPDLPRTYDRILTQVVEKNDPHLAIKMFHWIAAAKRPLSTDELRQAIAIEPLGKAHEVGRLVHDMAKAMSCCGNLVFVNEENHTAHFTHSSVKQYLTSPDLPESLKHYHIDMQDADQEVGIGCVTFLNYSDGALTRQEQSSEAFTEVPNYVRKISLPRGKSGSLIDKAIAHEAERRLQSRRKPNRVLQEVAGYTEDQRRNQEREKDIIRPYAESFWLEHTKRRIDPSSSRLWAHWCDTVEVESSEWAKRWSHVPWREYDWKHRSDSVLNWVVEQDHCSLAQYLVMSNPTLHDEQVAILLNGAAANGHHDLVDIYLHSRNIPQYHRDRALFEASRSGQLTMVNHLLAAHADADAKSNDRYKPLRAAAAGGFLNIVQRLLQEHPDVNLGNTKYADRTPLQDAAGGGHLEIVELLLEHEADINTRAHIRKTGRSALQAAAAGGHDFVVASLLRKGADVNAPAGDDGRTALQAAAEIGHLKIMSRLMNSRSQYHHEKADVNAAPAVRGGRTALQAAAGNGHEGAVAILLAEGAEVNASGCYGPEGRTALQAAAENGHIAVVDMLLSAKEKAHVNSKSLEGYTALQAAARAGHLHIMDRLLKEGADCNANPYYHHGRTALQAAAEGGHKEAVEKLLEAGAAVNADPCDEEGLTALQAAAKYGELDLVDVFFSRDYGPKVNAPAGNHNGYTALQAAAAGGHLKVIGRLLEEEADVNAPGCEVGGRTALQAAAGGGHLTAVRRLIQEKADINAASSPRYGRTAVQAAAENGHESVVKELLQAGAKTNTPLQELGATALRAAAEGGFLNVVRTLLNAGATDEAEEGTVMGMRARYAAMIHCHSEVERFLEEAGFPE